MKETNYKVIPRSIWSDINAPLPLVFIIITETMLYCLPVNNYLYPWVPIHFFKFTKHVITYLLQDYNSQWLTQWHSQGNTYSETEDRFHLDNICSQYSRYDYPRYPSVDLEELTDW